MFWGHLHRMAFFDVNDNTFHIDDICNDMLIMETACDTCSREKCILRGADIAFDVFAQTETNPREMDILELLNECLLIVAIKQKSKEVCDRMLANAMFITSAIKIHHSTDYDKINLLVCLSILDTEKTDPSLARMCNLYTRMNKEPMKLAIFMTKLQRSPLPLV